MNEEGSEGNSLMVEDRELKGIFMLLVGCSRKV